MGDPVAFFYNSRDPLRRQPVDRMDFINGNGAFTGVAATRQSAANFPVSGKACGALPRRRYARKVLESFLGC